MIPVKTLLVDDNAIIRQAIRHVVDAHDEIIVIAELSDGADVLDFLKSNEIDVILMDISMKNMDGIEATKLVTLKYPKVKVIALSSHEEDYYKEQMFSAGACDYLSKWSANHNEIRAAILRCSRVVQ